MKLPSLGARQRFSEADAAFSAIVAVAAWCVSVAVATTPTVAATARQDALLLVRVDREALTEAPLIRCMSNASCSVTNGSSGRYDVASFESPKPPLWCPEGYRQYKTNLQCVPRPCVRVPFSRDPGPSEEGNVTTFKTICAEKFSPRFASNCTKTFLTEAEYTIENDGSLWNWLVNETLPLGDYWTMGGRAIVCDSNSSNVTLPASMPAKCIPGRLTGEYYRLLPNGTLLVVHSGRIVAPGYFRGNGSVADVCVKMDMDYWGKCGSAQIAQYGVLDAPGDFTVQPNLDVRVHRGSGSTYGPDQYVLAAHGTQLVICLVNPGTVKRRETQVLYGAAFTMSAVCLLLALVAHSFFPALNYHTKTLLFLSFSLMVFYSANAAYQFNGRSFQSAAANLIVFALIYIFGLSAFFWISVIAFDLWRVFAKMKGSFGGSSNSAQKKRLFYAKCAYAFGIPVVMYIILISIAFSTTTQQKLNLELHPEERAWFVDDTTRWALFYGPIAILLVENLLFFVLTVVNIKKASQGTDMVNKRASKKLVRVYLKLFVVLGLSWILEVISAALEGQVDEMVWYVTDVINGLQGVFIFLIYVCKKRTWLILRHKLGYIDSSRVTETTTSTQDGSGEHKTAVKMDSIRNDGCNAPQ